MLEALYQTLQERRRPEDVAQIILDTLGGRLSGNERRILEVAARGSLKQRVNAYTSMAQEFRRPVGAERQVAKAQELFTTAYALTPAQSSDPVAIEAFVRHVSAEIRKDFGASEFKFDRLNREQRQAMGLEHSRRRYNKLFRQLSRLEEKLHRLIREEKKREFFLIGKSALASRLSWEEFSKDADTACFIAYYVARCNLRSEFTISGQQRPYDTIADTLFRRLRGAASLTNWYALAYVYADSEVLVHLTASQQGELLGHWYGLLCEVAVLLKETWDRSDIDRATMIVRRGNDSSTWNQTAGAWNRTRDHWIALLYALGMEDVLRTVICPGKALRLMAADVAWWHRSAGGGLDSNTLVWSELPLPWQALLGDATCTLSTIEAACGRHGVDPIKAGWTAPRPRTAVAPFRPTPELVHGVTVGNPQLATLLRRAGVFSGKQVKPERLLEPL